MCFAIDRYKWVLIDYSPILPKLPTILACFLCQLMTDEMCWHGTDLIWCFSAERLSLQDVTEQITQRSILTRVWKSFISFLFILTWLFMCPECHLSVWLIYHQGLLDEWTSKGPAVQELNSKGSALCSLITFLTSPAKTKTPNKSGNHYIRHVQYLNQSEEWEAWCLDALFSTV